MSWSTKLELWCSSLLLLMLVAPAAAGPARSTPPPQWRGEWLITRDLGAPGISAMTDRQAHRMIGAKIVIEPAYARFSDDICKDVGYAVNVQKTQDFLLGYNITSMQLPLVGDEVRTLEVSCGGAPFHDLSALRTGCVILVWDGRFFEAQRRGSNGRSPRCLI
ncbi:MAG TPA: hypothetical protein VJ728_01920 [Candidatus Binataceae bacterium]|nr:hypothetical protein [Candidatus Binataceae bacterium]